jgi:hypothetical protein
MFLQKKNSITKKKLPMQKPIKNPNFAFHYHIPSTKGTIISIQVGKNHPTYHVMGVAPRHHSVHYGL